jgi:hypothetical protein
MAIADRQERRAQIGVHHAVQFLHRHVDHRLADLHGGVVDQRIEPVGPFLQPGEEAFDVRRYGDVGAAAEYPGRERLRIPVDGDRPAFGANNSVVARPIPPAAPVITQYASSMALGLWRAVRRRGLQPAGTGAEAENKFRSVLR